MLPGIPVTVFIRKVAQDAKLIEQQPPRAVLVGGEGKGWGPTAVSSLVRVVLLTLSMPKILHSWYRVLPQNGQKGRLNSPEKLIFENFAQHENARKVRLQAGRHTMSNRKVGSALPRTSYDVQWATEKRFAKDVIRCSMDNWEALC